MSNRYKVKVCGLPGGLTENDGHEIDGHEMTDMKLEDKTYIV